jgi:Rad3-related DNA helicase
VTELIAPPTPTQHCPATPAELGLPAASWWPGQRDTIELIVQSFFAGKKFVMAGIPTGGGKTIIAAAVQKIIARDQSQVGNSLALTHTIQLQQQYVRTLPDAKIVTGRANHLCELAADSDFRIGTDPVKSPLTAEDAPCNGGQCPEGKKGPDGCAYYQQWWVAARAPMVVMNYAYATRILQQSYFAGEQQGDTMPNPFRRTLLVADECHLTEGAIRGASGTKIQNAIVQRAGLNFPSEHTRIRVQETPTKAVFYENVPVWVDWAVKCSPVVDKMVSDAAQQLQHAQSMYRDDPSKGNARTIGTARGALKRAQSFKASMDILAGLDPEKHAEWLVRRDYDQTKKYAMSATIEPLWGWTTSKTVLFNHFQKVLLMSATPGDPEVARVTLGIPKEQFEYIERPSTFPIDNRPVYFWDCGKLNYQSSDAQWERIGKAIAWIAVNEPYASRKGIVHAGSKANAHRLVRILNRLIPGDRFFTHGETSDGYASSRAFSREEALDEFVKSTSPRVLVTASFTTGLDLPYIIGWQVIAKVPYGSLADEITARRRAFKLSNGYSFGQQVYESEAMNTVVQAAGRIVRAQDDSGPTFIIDGNYPLLHMKAYRPRFYTDAYRKLAWEGGTAHSAEA